MGMSLIAFLASVFLATQTEPTNLLTDGATSPPRVSDHRPQLSAQNNLTVAANRWQIQLTTSGDSTFSSPLWSSRAPNRGTGFPGGAAVASGVQSPLIPYGQGSANLLSLPLLTWNTTYRWRTRFGQGGTWSGFSQADQFTMASPTWSVAQQQNNGDPAALSWRFVGVPIAFGTTVPATVLLGSVQTLYRLDEPTRTWVQLGPSDVLQGGQGYLAWCSPSTVFTLNQGSVTAGIPAVKDNTGATTTPSYDLTSDFAFTSLAAPTGQEIPDGVPANSYRGNALFANPYYAPISWRSSTTNGPPFGDIARLNISYAMYKWDGTQYLTYNGVTLVGAAGEWIDPFQSVGIWVQATPYDLWVNTPAPLNGGVTRLAPQKQSVLQRASSPPPAADPDHWHLRIEARSGTALDTENCFGIDPAADDAWDVRDSEEPGPGTPSWVLVYFDHRADWTLYPRKYTHDFRKTRTKAGDEVVWTFTVDGNTNLPATLTWPNLGDIPAGDWHFTLEDPARPAPVDLSLTTSYDTLPVSGPSTLKLRAVRLKDSLVSPPAPSGGGGGGGGGSCGLLGPEGVILAVWLYSRRKSRMSPIS